MLPSGIDPQDSGFERGKSPDEALAAKDILNDDDVPAFDRVSDVPPTLRLSIRVPQVPAELQPTGVFVISSSDGSLFQATQLWHRETNRDRTPGLADLIVTRTLSMQPPVIVAMPGGQREGSWIRSWEIIPVTINGKHGLYHKFTNDPAAPRVSQQSDGIQWFDDEGYFNAVIGWQMSLADLRAIAASLVQ